MWGKAAAAKTQTPPAPHQCGEKPVARLQPTTGVMSQICKRRRGKTWRGGAGHVVPGRTDSWDTGQRVKTHNSSSSFPVKPSGGLHSDKTMWLAKT